VEKRDAHIPLSGVNLDVWQFSELILKTRFARALEEGASRYAIHRSLRFAARTKLETLFDTIALQPSWRAQRIDSSTILLDSDGLFVSCYGTRKAAYCSCFFGIWADTPERADKARETLLDLVKDSRVTEPMFSIDWHFLTSKHELESAAIEELADDILLDEAYPDIPGGVNAFVDRYLEASETVLVLQGPPGTGKTRLIRAILGQISRRKGGEAQALYTGDKKALECDQLFVKFITGWDDAFVLEDADHLLKPRADGNEELHRFLTIADGVVKAQGRKIIFSTNLPNVHDLDEALIRPGRCFARIATRSLKQKEAIELLKRLEASAASVAALQSSEQQQFSLAEIYKAAAA
jgi:energy-coupling factor transporter ATP-binding protein EcfA2